MSEETSGDNYAWRLSTGGWWCKDKDGQHNTKIPSTPYINKARFFPSVESAEFMRPSVDFSLTLCKVKVSVEEIAEYRGNKRVEENRDARA